MTSKEEEIKLKSHEGEALIASTSIPRPKTALLGRRIARFFARWLPCYGRNASVDAAWDYFENITLPRRKEDGKGGYEKALRGEKGVATTLYPAWTTRQSELKDFGTGVAVYFETLLALIIICLVAGLIYIPTLLYYSSDEYASVGKDDFHADLRGSLICPQTEWVPCPSCTKEQWSKNLGLFATAGDLTFVRANECADMRLQEGVNHLVVVLFLTIAIFGLGFHQRKLELKYDEDMLTASDYSIKVDNPPHDATDPEEWKEFFSKFDGAEVVYVTVALDNEELVKALAKRRLLVQKLRYSLRTEGDCEKVSLDDIIAFAKESLPKDYKKLVAAENRCRELLEPDYVTTSIFVTFETEKAQRAVLKALSVGRAAIINNMTGSVDFETLFRGELVLDVQEAVEPSSIRWQDQDETTMTKIIQRTFTSILTIIVIGADFWGVRAAFETNVTFAAFLIAILNILGPQVFKFINSFEAHPNEGGFQASLYAKICAFRWINTAIITTMVTPFTSTISTGSGGLIDKVHAVLKAEIVTLPIVHMCDIMGTIKRHILAPGAANQEAMNMYFRGSVQSLGEKYTNMTKLIFLCFFYSVVFPASFFFGAVALVAVYFTDRFLLLRSWGPLPELGDDVAKLGRLFYFPLTLVALAIMSEFYWSAYPFDNLCDTNKFVGPDGYEEYSGTHSAVVASGSSETITIVVAGDGESQIYKYCDQDFRRRLSSLLSPFEEDRDAWMSDDQQLLTFVFGIVAVAMVILMIGFLCWRSLFGHCMGIFKGTYHTEEKDSGMRFSDQPHIRAYVPQLADRRFAHPLIACDMADMSVRHIGWSDPLRGHEFYDLSKDVARLSDGKYDKKPLLSLVKYWPGNEPEELLKPSTESDGYGSLDTNGGGS